MIVSAISSRRLSRDASSLWQAAPGKTSLPFLSTRAVLSQSNSLARSKSRNGSPTNNTDAKVSLLRLCSETLLQGTYFGTGQGWPRHLVDQPRSSADAFLWSSNFLDSV
ncbi:hypothetical protein THAOC_25722 [Thalassiosira oceanica]|uniref:Uncharacterized protein n=1 Tax=Thalassiosira oceanica TaxID=159749 RepID=K0S0P5_THAOC|nr:hypothetical protein THAOC_25722 [Thalassiosira oceanica]|eukprot:EJK54631.1 hypothetical protein THAOC_25722 [Thalassiosira oceanica]